MRSDFRFKHFTIRHEFSALPVTTDACIFGALTQFNNPVNIIDLGCGTGLLSLFMNQKYPDAQILGIDNHLPSVQEAQFNISKNQKDSSISIIQGDFFEFNSTEKYNIICNPPFFENQLKSDSIEKSVSRHFDKNGYTQLIQKMAELLGPNSKASMLIPSLMVESLVQLINKNQLFTVSIEFIKHNINKKSHVAILCFVKEYTSQISTKEIILKDNQNKYLPEIVELLSPFYLDMAL